MLETVEPLPGAVVVLVHKHAVSIRVWMVEGEILLGTVSVAAVLAKVGWSEELGCLRLRTACSLFHRQSCASRPVSCSPQRAVGSAAGSG